MKEGKWGHMRKMQSVFLFGFVKLFNIFLIASLMPALRLCAVFRMYAKNPLSNWKNT